MKSIVVKFEIYQYSFVNPLTNKIKILGGYLPKDSEMRWFPNFKEEKFGTNLTINYIGKSPYNFISGYIATFEHGGDSHYISSSTEKLMLDWLETLDEETIDNKQFNFRLSNCLYYYNSSNCTSVEIQSFKRPFLTIVKTEPFYKVES